MKMKIKETIKELCEIPGPVGFEEKVAGRIKELLETYMDDVWIDTLGNVIGVRKCGKQNACKLLFDAHIDEIGLIVTGVEEGFLRFARLGGLDARVIPASCVQLLTDPPLYGVISVLPPHVLKEEDTKNNFKIDDLFIDTGLPHEEAERLITPGTPGVMDYKVRDFGENQICGKALDDRASFVAILRALDLLKNIKLDVDLYVMASTQEEVGSPGAASGAFAISPDYCVVIDVDHVKTPDTKQTDTSMGLGDGVIITHGPNMNPAFTKKMINIAEANEIKHQINVKAGSFSGTNARVIQISKEGVATGLLGLPMKYMHSTNELISLDDIEYIAKLLGEIAKEMKSEVTK